MHVRRISEAGHLEWADDALEQWAELADESVVDCDRRVDGAFRPEGRGQLDVATAGSDVARDVFIAGRAAAGDQSQEQQKQRQLAHYDAHGSTGLCPITAEIAP